MVDFISANWQTRSGRVNGYLWKRVPQRSIAHAFNADLPIQGSAIHPPYVDIEGSFSRPSRPRPRVFDTLIWVSGHALLVSGYFDERIERNANLKRDFPLIPWRGEIAVLFIGKRKPFITWGPPQSIVHLAIAQYVFICYSG